MSQLEKFSLEFAINATPRLLYTLISTPEGLSRWFADAVFASDDIYKFVWEGSEHNAKLLQFKENEFVSFEWLDDFHMGYKLDMLIQSESLSSGVSLVITDFAEPSEMDFYRRLWDTQVKQLQRLFNA